MVTANHVSLLSPFIAIAFVFLLGRGYCEDLCNGCPSADLLTAPGLGIDLTMAYGTAAVYFANGTTHDLVKIDGTPEYLAAMRLVAEDALNVRSGLSSLMRYISLPDTNPYPLREYWWMPWAWYYSIRRSLYEWLTPDPDPAQIPDEWILTMAAMLSDIKSTVMQALTPPPKFPIIGLSWPDFEADTAIYKARFEYACHLAGLDSDSRGNIVSTFALPYEEIWDDFDDRYKLSDKHPSAVLVASYNSASLGITLNTLEPTGWLWPERVLESTQHGARHATPPGTREEGSSETYWTEVTGLFEKTIGNETVDYLILLGSHARSQDLFRAIERVVENHKDINPSILDRYRPPVSGGRGGREYTVIYRGKASSQGWQGPSKTAFPSLCLA